MNKSVKPDFIYAGAPKAGSSWLFEMLRAHPEIYVPPAKDLHFFDKYYSKGLKWYEKHFTHTDKSICGELSHDYFTEASTADRIASHLPSVKLIFCLRDPADLTLSAWRYARNHSSEFNTSFAHYSKLPISVKQIDYVNNLGYFYQRFPPQNLYVFFFDEIKNSPELLIKSIYAFLGADDQFVPNNIHEKINAAKTSRLSSVTNAAYLVAIFLRKIGLANLLGYLKSTKFIDGLLYQKANKMDLKNLTEEELSVYKTIAISAKQSNSKLEQLIGKRTPSNWYQCQP